MNPAGLAEVLATFGPAYLASHELPRGTAKVWRAISPAARRHWVGMSNPVPIAGRAARLSFLPQPPLPALPDARQGGVAAAARRREVLPVPYFHLGVPPCRMRLTR